MATRIPWAQIEAEYITGDISLPDLAKRWGISQRALEYHSSRNEWVRKRQEWRESVEQRIKRQAISKLALNLADVSQSHWEMTRKMRELVAKVQDLLDQALQFQSAEVEEHSRIERRRDPKYPSLPESLTLLAAITPLVREWTNILNTCVRLERDILALQFEHPALAINYLSRLGYEVLAPNTALPAAQDSS